MDFTDKPGSALEHVIPNWLPKGSGCKCNDWKHKMDQWGYSGCVAHYDQILERLMQQSEKLPAMLAATPEFMRKAVAKKMIDKALALSGPAHDQKAAE